MNRAQSNKIYTHLTKKARKIAIITHKNPDGDALGAATALKHIIAELDGSKEVHIGSLGTIPHNLAFLPHYFLVQDTKKLLTSFDPDTIIVVDSGDLSHTGCKDLIEELAQKKTLINIDHHSTNQKYGDINYVDPRATSTTALIYQLCKNADCTLDASLATSLLTGIITDTNNFRNAATNISSLTYASDLIHAGADLQTIQRNVFQDKTLASLHLWGVLLTRIEKHPELDFVYTYISQAEMEALSPTRDDGGFANFLNNISEGLFGLFMSEIDAQSSKVSLRTTREDINVAKIAQHFGGGGHQKAAGFTIQKPVIAALEYVFETLKAHRYLLDTK